jgi:hypothetical protein
MSVKAMNLDNQERGMKIVTRENGPEQGLDHAAELQALRDRIATAKMLQPTVSERHCLDCFERGRNAALRLIEGG